MFRIYLIIIVVGIIGGALFGAKYYYDTTQATIATLRENNAKLEVVAKSNQQTIDTLQATAQQMQLENQKLQTEMREAEKYREELIGKLQKHNLSALSLKKPGLIEKRINNGTKKVFDDLTAITQPPAN